MRHDELTPELVAAFYRAFFDREPDDATVQAEISEHGTVDAFLRHVFGTPDFFWAAQRELASGMRSARLRGKVNLSGTSEEMDALIAHTREVWARYGEDDPYYSVLTHDKYRGKELSPEARDAFFATGANRRKILFEVCERNGLRPNRDGTVLDFGCGLGRVGEHLAPRFGRYVGVDISAPHLSQAKERFAAVGITNATFRTLGEFMERPDIVDVAYSMIVLQHNPPPLIVKLLQALCRSVKGGGILFFQLPVALFGYSFDLATYLKTVSPNGPMEMHCIPQREVHSILEAGGCRLVEVFPDGSIGRAGLSCTFVAVKK